MFIKTLRLGVCMTNCYIVSGDNKNCVIIDPASDGDVIISEVIKCNLMPTAIIITHGHYDHISALNHIKKAYKDIKIYIHSQEVDFLINTNLNLSIMFGDSFTYSGDYMAISDGDEIYEGGVKFEVLHTPGHTKGSCCFIAENNIFSGDTLFASTIGRTDFPTGSFDTLIESLHKINKLEGSYNIYPGHNGETTLDREKKYNEYMQL